ncbi:helix-turn-helix domain-containing protein [Jiella avicenniae]|uniref:Helix-turn-helix domain-containing protein n=1 Tax=Jiella avicenniae TaxID=2907202 RepID=A0A9X1TDP9_9HYPH|nr:helix-turn-helix domain-containing protein [Jiella avicenniae]MCE7030388.1 helix-turn-helix domain-containing protein [Jiella avicenniae]
MATFELDPLDPPRPSAEASRRLAGLTEEAIDALQASDTDAAPPSDAMLERAVVARRLKRLRERLNFNQVEFATRYRIPVATLRDWEQARRSPDAPALAYLAVIEAEPEAVDRALGGA